MRCERCGTEVVEGAEFCHKCGSRLGPAAVDVPRNPITQPARGEGSAPSETTLWEGSYSPKAMIGTWILCALVSVAIVVAGLVLAFEPLVWLLAGAVLLIVWLVPLASLLWNRLSVRYRLTNQRFFHERGVLRRVTDRIEVIDMDDISVEQGIIERTMGVGSIRITSSDRSDPKLILKGIDDVNRVATLLDDARRAERSRRGVYIESV
jgi:membrane protein YdbS with pleckstrin-like domain